jgi:hypothetical protein
LLPLAAFAVHQIRYLLGYGHEIGDALTAQGHSYLSVALPVLVAIAGSAVGTVLIGASLGSSAQRRRRPSVLRCWLACAFALTAIFSVQELVEGALVAGHPAGLEAIFAHGGWIGLPAAAAIGGALTLALAGLAAAEGLMAKARPLAFRLRPPRALMPGNLRRVRRLASDPLVFGLARRPPPPQPARS